MGPRDLVAAYCGIRLVSSRTRIFNYKRALSHRKPVAVIPLTLVSRSFLVVGKAPSNRVTSDGAAANQGTATGHLQRGRILHAVQCLLAKWDGLEARACVMTSELVN